MNVVAEEFQPSNEILAHKMFIDIPGPVLALAVSQPRYRFSPVITYLQF